MATPRALLTQLATSGGSHRDLADKYRAVLESILPLGEDELVDGLKAFIEAIVNENVSLVISRQLLSEVATHLTKVEDSISKAVSHYTLEIVQPRVISFEDQVSTGMDHSTGQWQYKWVRLSIVIKMPSLGVYPINDLICRSEQFGSI